jgi:hypothetical protein
LMPGELLLYPSPVLDMERPTYPFRCRGFVGQSVVRSYLVIRKLVQCRLQHYLKSPTASLRRGGTGNYGLLQAAVRLVWPNGPGFEVSVACRTSHLLILSCFIIRKPQVRSLI